MALPKLHHLGVQDVATPVFWLGYLLVLVELPQFLIFLSQVLPVRDHRTLATDHSPNLAALGAGMEVVLGLLLWEFLHRAFHTHLTVQGLPVEDKRGKGIRILERREKVLSKQEIGTSCM